MILSLLLPCIKEFSKKKKKLHSIKKQLNFPLIKNEALKELIAFFLFVS